MAIRAPATRFIVGCWLGIGAAGVVAGIAACSTPTTSPAAVRQSGPKEAGVNQTAAVVFSAGTADASMFVDASMGCVSSAAVSMGSASSEPTGTAGLARDVLVGAPLAFAPTAHGFGVNAVLAVGAPEQLALKWRAQGELTWSGLTPASVMAPNVAQWQLAGLAAGTRYEYQLVLLSSAAAPANSEAVGIASSEAGLSAAGVSEVESVDAGLVEVVLYEGGAVTRRSAGEPFRFALISDSHIGANLSWQNQGHPDVLREVCARVAEAAPDFIINLGDLVDYHQFGFNVPPPDSSIAARAFQNYRSLLGGAAGKSAHFGVLGNWDGENGEFSEEQIQRSRQQRMLYVPNPGATTTPEGGSADQDYYAFTWGDALFVVLNVMTYTRTAHLLSSDDAGSADDWTLGVEQLNWLESTLSNSAARWRFTFIHHPVGGKAGNVANSAYGRGGGQAANVGEQATVHQMLQQYGVQVFFYGHDHQFMDAVVDGVHYTAPGVAGAPWAFAPEETGYPELPPEWQEPGWTQVDVTNQHVHVQCNAMRGSLVSEFTL